MKRTNKKGFTLVELLVVIAIIAIIAAVAVPVTISQIEKANISTAQNEAANAISAVQNAAAVIGTDSTKSFNAAGIAAELTASFSDPKQVDYIVISKAANGAKIEVVCSHTVKKAADNYTKGTIEASTGKITANDDDSTAVTMVITQVLAGIDPVISGENNRIILTGGVAWSGAEGKVTP